MSVRRLGLEDPEALGAATSAQAELLLKTSGV